MENKQKNVCDYLNEYNRYLLKKEIETEKNIVQTIKDNKLEERLIRSVGLSAISFLIISIALGFFKVPVILFPEFISTVVVGSSLGIGTIINSFLEKKFRFKERLSEIMSVKKQKDLLEQEIIHQIKYEIANNIMKAINETITKMDERNKIINSISSNYIIEHNTNLSINEINNNIDALKIKLNEGLQDLSIITKKCVLSEKFYNSRSKFESFINALVLPLMIGSGSMIIWAFPIIQTAGAVSALNLFLPLCLTTLAGSLYMIKKTKDNKSLFNKLNSELKENALSEEPGLEDKCLDGILNDEIKNISFIYTELIEQQELLSIKQREEKNKGSKESKNQLSNNINFHVAVSSVYDDSSEKSEEDINKRLVKKI